MTSRSRLLIALLAPFAIAFAAAAEAQNCTNGNNIYHRKLGGVDISCSQSSCHDADPKAGKNNILNGAQQPAKIDNALDTQSDMLGLRASLGLTPSDINDLALYIWYRQGNQQCPAATPSVGASPASLAFGSVNVGATSASQTVTLSNTGGAAANSLVIGAAPAGFARTTTCGASLAAGASCSITVTFSPTAASAYSGNISVTGTSTSLSIGLSGTGAAAAAPNVGATPSSLAFGSVAVGGTSGSQTVTVSNTGGAAANSFAVGAAPAGFARTTTCGATLGAGASCTITVTFSPTAASAYSGSISITGTGTSLSVGLSGSGAAAASSNVNASASFLSFGNVTVGQTSAAQTITVTNSGTAAATDMSYPAAPAKYNKSGTCASATLGAGASCTIVFSYSPTAVGADNATYTFTGGGKSFPIALSGAGVTTAPPAGQLSLPAAVTMPSTTVGTTSAPQAVSISNTGGAAVAVTSITSSNGGEFAVSGSTCTTVNAGGGCTFNITFTPAATGARSGTVTIVSSGTGSPQSIPVTGTGAAAGGGGGTPTTAIAVEYYHAAFDHYFITAIADEITKLDNGTFVGWARTGKQFKVYTAAGTGLSGVCRFFSTSFNPKSSHFYTADASECTVVKANADWTFEDTVFYVPTPTAAGSCPIGTMPVYRMYNNGQGAAPNHRFTIDMAVRSDMLSRPIPWVPEGYGIGVTMCSPL